MKRYRKWFFMALLILAATVGLVGLVNYIVDPYGLLRKDFSWQFIDPNKNYIKKRFIAQNPERFDCLVMGSSRVNSIDVRKIKGYKAYNVHYSFKRELSRLSGFYDFSGVNSVTTDNFNYLETSHYRLRVGDLVIARIFDDRTVNVAEDLGRWITGKNIDHHLKSLQQQANRSDISPAAAGLGDQK